MQGEKVFLDFETEHDFCTMAFPRHNISPKEIDLRKQVLQLWVATQQGKDTPRKKDIDTLLLFRKILSIPHIFAKIIRNLDANSQINLNNTLCDKGVYEKCLRATLKKLGKPLVKKMPLSDWAILYPRPN